MRYYIFPMPIFDSDIPELISNEDFRAWRARTSMQRLQESSALAKQMLSREVELDIRPVITEGEK